jgi:N-methylhydantoinase A/oxoprolinase/acetone carboxylase beta subunit
MLTLGPHARVFVALGATDMRKSFDTLAQEVRAAIGEDPLGGSLFVFSNRSRTRIKVLWFDRGVDPPLTVVGYGHALERHGLVTRPRGD